MRPAARLFVAVLLVMSALVSPLWAIAYADESRCSTETLAWVARAAAELQAQKVAFSATGCPAGRVRLRLAPAQGRAMDVEVAEPPGPAFRHAGRLRVSPILEVSDFKLLPAPEREAFEALASWLTTHEAEVVIAEAPLFEPPRGLRRLPRAPSEMGFPFASLVVLGLVLAAIGARKSFVEGAEEAKKRDFQILFVFALALRVLLGPFGPHHVNGQGPAWILGVIEDPSRLVGYGPGFVELFSLPARLFPWRPDLAIFLTNAIFAAAIPPLVLALASLLGLDRRRALIAAALAAVDPVSIRFAATESYFPAIIALSLAAAVALAKAANHLFARRFLPSLALATAACLWACQAARIHPSAWGPIALTPFWVFAAAFVSPTNKGNIARFFKALFACSVAALLLGLFVFVTSGSIIMRVAEQVGEHWNARDGLLTLLAFVRSHAKLVAAIVAIPLLLMRPRSALLPALVSLAALVATRDAYGQSELWRDSFSRVWLAAPAIAFAALLPKSVARARVAPVALAVILAALLVRGLPVLRGRTTEQLEYAFFRDALAALPKGCRVVYVPRAERRVVLLPEYALAGLDDGRRGAIEIQSSEEALALREPCLLYARTSLCSSEDGRAACDRLERGLDLAARARIAIPARPSVDLFVYDSEPVEVFLYDIRGHRAKGAP